MTTTVTTTQGPVRGRGEDVVAAADVDPVLQDMSSELLDLRRQLAELRQTVDERERQLAEARAESEGGERALGTLKGVLTDMIVRGRAELHAARAEADLEMSERLATVRAESDLLVAHAAAALAAALGRTPQRPPSPSTWPTSGPPTSTTVRPSPADVIRSLVNGQRPLDDASPAPAPAAPPGRSGPALPVPPPPASAAPPASSPPGSLAHPGSNIGAPGSRWPLAPAASRPARSVDDLSRTTNGSTGGPAPVLTLDYDLDERFEQVIGLRPNTQFRTPPRGVPVVPAPDPAAVPAAPTPPPASPADEAFGEFWQPPDEATPSEVTGGRLSFNLIDALLPIIALTLVLIVVLSWLG